MISSKKTYLGIAGGMLFLFLLFAITFIVLAINKDKPLFEYFEISSGLVLGLGILLVGFSISLYLALKKSQVSEK